MIPTAFDEENGYLNPPQGMSADDCDVLSVWRGRLEGNQPPVVVSCWKPTQQELDEIRRTGRVWVIVMGSTMPPVAVQGFSPFIPYAEEVEDEP